jgi:hypothetical protein
MCRICDGIGPLCPWAEADDLDDYFDTLPRRGSEDLRNMEKLLNEICPDGAQSSPPPPRTKEAERDRSGPLQRTPVTGLFGPYPLFRPAHILCDSIE